MPSIRHTSCTFTPEMAVNWLGGGLIGIGCACLTVVGIHQVEANRFQSNAEDTLNQQLQTTPAAPMDQPSLAPGFVVPLIGRLQIPRLHLSVIVVDGDDDATLARAVGHVHGTALPWEAGNAVLAGHRDTFFRPLRNIRKGDEIRVTTTRGTFSYRVVATEIVQPEDVSVLDPTPERSLTLVTCYPFVYVGSAPQRFIIHAK
jgi:sortase A